MGSALIACFEEGYVCSVVGFEHLSSPPKVSTLIGGADGSFDDLGNLVIEWEKNS